MHLQLFETTEKNRGAIVIRDRGGSHSAGDLLAASAAASATLLGGTADLNEARIAYLIPPGFEHVATQWGIWRAGGIAVPLAVTHPPPELAHVLDDAQVSTVVATPDLEDRVTPLAADRSLRLLSTTTLFDSTPGPLPHLELSRPAMILYTSGTTGRPKGAVVTHGNVQAQVEALVQAWEWTADDHILHVLPLHHVHGIVNALTCALWVGATCELMPFDPEAVLNRFSRGGLTLFMAVPTIYSKLIAAWEVTPAEEKRAVTAGFRRMRLMVSGSAALPAATLEKWKAITGHVLLERYGMTEIGMALSNPLHGTRVPGYVGSALPGVEVRLVDDSDRPIEEPGAAGEIQVRGPAVFSGYWGRPEETGNAFSGAWFRTGDIALQEGGAYRILGRKSVDIIKTGGHKVSALEIEGVLLGHPGIRECAVIGLSDEIWGERVGVCVAVMEGSTLELRDLRNWAADWLAPYKIPTRMKVVEQLPRNAMGKVLKPALAALFEG